MLEHLRAQSKAGLVPFVMAGYPSLEASERVACALVDEGAVALEIGVPFSDPLADGPVIQLAAEKALAHGVELTEALALISRLAKKYPKLPLILFTYFNPIHRLGVETYTRMAKEAGVTATLVVDLPPEEAGELIAAHRDQGLKNVFLISPTTSEERIRTVAEASSGFIYLVSRLGVTGTHGVFSNDLATQIQRIRSVTDLPIAVGFGISSAEHARQAARLAEGVVVGSAFVKLCAAHSDPRRLEEAVRELARSLTAGIRQK